MKKKLELTISFIYDEDELLEFERGPGQGDPTLEIKDIQMDFWATFIQESIAEYWEDIVNNNSSYNPLGIDHTDDFELEGYEVKEVAQ